MENTCFILSSQVHKILLAATSDYFRAMLQGPMRESKEDSVDLKGLTADSLEPIIDFMYSGSLHFDFDNLIEILNAASHLQVNSALDLCSEYMISMLTFSNADELLNIADTYSLSAVTDFYNNKVLQNFEDFSATEQFLKLTAPQLSKYLADDNLRVKSEATLYDIVAKWYAHDQTRGDHLEGLLKFIRFSLMSETQLQQLQQHWLTGRFLQGMRFIQEGLKYHSDASVGHPWIDDNAKLRCDRTYLTMVHQGSSFQPFEITGFDHIDSKYYQLESDISGSRDCRCSVIDNLIYISRVVDCGGGTLMNSLLRFDPRHLKLQELAPCRRLRIDPALVAKGQWLYLFGGTNEHYSLQDTVECYDVRTNSWMDLMPLPVPMHSQAATVCGSLIYVSGGVAGQERQPTATMYSYDPATHQWETKSPMHFARRLHEMVPKEDIIFVLGGIGMHSFNQQTQIPIESYNTTTDQWTMLTSTLAGRSVGHFVPFEGKILSLGREHYEATEDDIWIYDTETDTWKTYTKVPRRTRLATASGVMLYVNFFDERLVKRGIASEKR